MDIPEPTDTDPMPSLASRVTRLEQRLDTLTTLLEQTVHPASTEDRLTRLEVIAKLTDTVAELVARRPKRARRLPLAGCSSTSSRQVSPSHSDGEM